MASSALPSASGTNLDGRESKDDESISSGLSEQELVDLVETSEIRSWDMVFYHLGLPMPQRGLKMSTKPLGIIRKILCMWVERGDRSLSKLVDIINKLHEKDIASELQKEYLAPYYDVLRHLAPIPNLLSSLKDKWKERQVLAQKKLTDYLSNQRDAIQSSEEPVETLAKRFFEGCLREMDYSLPAKQIILQGALNEAGFAQEAQETSDLNEIAACFDNREQLLSMVDCLTKHEQQYTDIPEKLQDTDDINVALCQWEAFIINTVSRAEWQNLLLSAQRETELLSEFPIYEEVNSTHVTIVDERFPIKNAENLALALGFQEEEVESLLTSYHPRYTLSLWSKRTSFSRHRLFLALCLSGYSTFATSNLYDMSKFGTLVTKSFSRSGGEVVLQDEGIRLSIPMGALSENQKITLQPLEEGPLMPSTEEVSICPGFRVSPSGLSFSSRIKVTLDHCATILQRDRAGKEGIVVYVRQEEGPKEQWKVVRYDLSTSTDCPVEVILTNDKVELYLMHFTSFWIRIKSAFIRNKRIGCTPFLPKYMPANRKPVLRLYVHNISEKTVKMIREEEENSCPVYHQTTPHDQFLVIPNGQGLTVTCNDEGSIVAKTVSFENLLTLRRHARNRLEFELDFGSLKHGEKNVKVDLFQGVEEKKKEMIIPTTFKGSESIGGRSAQDTSRLESEAGQSHIEPCVTDDVISAGIDALRLENKEDMLLSRASASASASAGMDVVTSEKLVEIADAIPAVSFVAFFVYLGFSLDYAFKVLERWGRSYRSASEQLLGEWAERHNDKHILREALLKSELQFLASQYLPS